MQKRIHDFSCSSPSTAIDEVRQMQLQCSEIVPTVLVQVIKDFGNTFGVRRKKE